MAQMFRTNKYVWLNHTTEENILIILKHKILSKYFWSLEDREYIGKFFRWWSYCVDKTISWSLYSFNNFWIISRCSKISWSKDALQGQKSLASKFEPISLLPLFYKIIEGLVHNLKQIVHQIKIVFFLPISQVLNVTS